MELAASQKYKRKFNLFKKTNHFCSVPWNLLYVKMDGSIYTCTKGSYQVGDLKTDSMDQIINNIKRNEIKNEIIADKKSENCKNCLKLENNDSNKNYGFLRNMYNDLFKKNDIDYDDTESFVLGGLDLHWSSICNLKCITCWAEQSSLIAKEQGLPVQHTPPYAATKLINYVEKNQDNLKEVYLSGGEPMYINYNLNLLKKLKKRPDLRIRVNSNMMWEQDNKILKEIIKFPNVLFTCSADSTNEKFEYIRRGAKWDKFVNNIKFLQSHKNVKVRINLVFFALNGTSITDIIDFFHDNVGIKDFTINQCGMGHTYLRCRNLPSKSKEKAKQKILIAKEKYHYDLNLVGQLNNCLKELNHAKTEDFSDYLNYIDSESKDLQWKNVFWDLIQ